MNLHRFGTRNLKLEQFGTVIYSSKFLDVIKILVVVPLPFWYNSSKCQNNLNLKMTIRKKREVKR